LTLAPRREKRTLEVTSVDTTHLRVLQQAVRLLGDEKRLASALNVPPETLSEWLAGKAPPTTKAYFAALVIVTSALQER
jgi:DNA-binding transcriptional regulator YiaG